MSYQVSEDGKDVVVFGSGSAEHTLCDNPYLALYGDSTAEERKLDGTFVVFGSSPNHAIGIFFKGYNSIRIRCEENNVVCFFDVFGKKLLKMNLNRIGGIEGLRRFLDEEDTPGWSGRLMYDFNSQYIKGGTYFGDLSAIAEPFEDEKRNGTEVPQYFADLLFKKYV